jgi:hypothetical protein
LTIMRLLYGAAIADVLPSVRARPLKKYSSSA